MLQTNSLLDGHHRIGSSLAQLFEVRVLDELRQGYVPGFLLGKALSKISMGVAKGMTPVSRNRWNSAGAIRAVESFTQLQLAFVGESLLIGTW